jgi:hypothetical protein
VGAGGVSGAAAAGSLSAGSVAAGSVAADESGEEVEVSLAEEASAFGDDVLAAGAPESGVAGGLPAARFVAEGELAGAAAEAESFEVGCGVCVVDDAAAGALVLGVGGAGEVASVASGA